MNKNNSTRRDRKISVLYKESADRAKLELFNDVVKGLSSSPKCIPSKYLYDKTGSSLYEEITQLKEYYLWEAELELFKKNAQVIVSSCKLSPASTISIVELGAGDGSKTRVLLEAFISQNVSFTYYPVDISHDAMRSLLVNFSHLNADIHAVAADYVQGLKAVLEMNPENPVVLLFVGSTIGNLPREECSRFLMKIYAALREGDTFITGWDLKKSPDVIHAAYNDKAGVTTKFIKNILTRINRELRTDIKLDDFNYHASYDPVEGYMRLFLVPLMACQISIPAVGSTGRKNTISLKKLEPIFISQSQKFNVDEAHSILQNAGFSKIRDFFDPQLLFLETIAQK